MKALMVFSDTSRMEGLNQALAGTKMETECCSSLSDLRTRLGRERRALVFCQARLPDGTFRDLLRLTGSPDSKIAVVVCSEFYEKGTYIEAMSMGAFDYVALPYRKSELEWIVGNALHGSSLHKHSRAPQGAYAGQAPLAHAG
jgi:DNA-binding NtrC family response regulator